LTQGVELGGGGGFGGGQGGNEGGELTQRVGLGGGSGRGRRKRGIVGNEAAKGVVGDEKRGVREGQFGNWTGAVAGVYPALDGGPIKGVTRREDNGVGHDFE